MGSLPVVNRTAQPVSKTPFASSPIAFPLKVPPSCLRDRPNSRSPVESPPLLKKPLRFIETGKLFSKAMDSPLSCILGSRSEATQENRSILKSVSREVPCKNRKVSFQRKVLVFHFDREQGGHVCSESQILNVEPEVKKNILRQSYSSSTASSINSTTCVHSPSPRQPDVGKHRLELSYGGSSFPKRSSPDSPTPQRRVIANQNKPEVNSQFSKIQFQFASVENRTSVLRFSLQLGAGTSAGDVIVKANKTGNRVRILGTENHNREINERFGLPVMVDPYGISARMDSNGMLFVEAPILSGELKN